MSRGVSFERSLVLLLGRNAFPSAGRQEVKHCCGETLSGRGGINAQNLLPRSVFKANSLCRVRGG